MAPAALAAQSVFSEPSLRRGEAERFSTLIFPNLLSDLASWMVGPAVEDPRTLVARVDRDRWRFRARDRGEGPTVVSSKRFLKEYSVSPPLSRCAYNSMFVTGFLNFFPVSSLASTVADIKSADSSTCQSVGTGCQPLLAGGASVERLVVVSSSRSEA